MKNNNYSFYNNINNQRNNYKKLPLKYNYRNDQMMDIPREFYDYRIKQNQNHFQNRPNQNIYNLEYAKIKPNTPLLKDSNYLTRDIQEKGVTKYIRYKNHSYVLKKILFLNFKFI